ncbi:MAG: sulfatase [Bacteroidota bacterium]
MHKTKRYTWQISAVLVGLLILIVTGFRPWASENAEQPNVVIIFTDDLGYGDLGAYGHPTIQTPHLDRMAQEGMKFTQFYSAASVCTPSRAALLTGRLPIRSGMASNERRVLFPDSKYGIPAEEITLAEALKAQGYATAAVGKWHLGHLAPYLPTNNGFDSYYGIPYSNDMDRVVGGEWRSIFWEPEPEFWNVPLMRDEEIIERPADQYTITRRYTEEAVKFIEANKSSPFFLYLAHSLPHTPLFTDEAFADVSRRGLYGDVIEEIDWSVGQVLDALRDEGLAERTLVFFTSDNGPWLIFDTHGGSSGLLRGGKGMTWEGGMREPGIAWWPGTVPANSVQMEVTSTMDLYPTALAMAGATLADDRIYDGKNLLPMLKGEEPGAVRDTYFYYRGARIFAVRKGPWKAHFMTQWAYKSDNEYTEHDPPLLFHLDHDPSEKYNIAEKHPEVIADIKAAVAAHQEAMVARPDQLVARIGEE